MREIKFRGICIEGNHKGKWIYGFYVNFNDNFNEKTKEKSLGSMIYIFKEDKYYKVDFNSVTEFTGTLDKNGKEIYKGDIIKAYKSKGRLENLQFTIFEVKFMEGNFELCKDYEIENLGTLSSYNCLEVIGNIYENPELLEDKNG